MPVRRAETFPRSCRRITSPTPRRAWVPSPRSANTQKKCWRKMRSMLFVPAAKWPMIPKAATSAADGVCVDLEDSVPAGEKEAARKNVSRAFIDLDFGARTRMMRMNGLDTPFAYRDLVDVIEAAGDRIDLVMVPKVGSPADVAFVATL